MSLKPGKKYVLLENIYFDNNKNAGIFLEKGAIFLFVEASESLFQADLILWPSDKFPIHARIILLTRTPRFEAMKILYIPIAPSMVRELQKIDEKL